MCNPEYGEDGDRWSLRCRSWSNSEVRGRVNAKVRGPYGATTSPLNHPRCPPPFRCRFMEQGAASQLRTVVRPPHHFGQTSRPDLWWAKPSMLFIALSAFVAYCVWAVIQGR